ncbi:TRAP transporter substrate-binding protein DctP [Stappia taiwanensis]|uniref:TRAP transporter substrate-binding protein DctP n=1 Tax=Stappia taiwanensis TaxID=992267 RepID=A0A838XYY6_9HYPH|nr:TRAP transporter substrate-binding protein DctP [Stappia taiwanensis]MBA4612073.1 TRAP transporter substrate-binding protein DctP [Stappia taiwanensis]GGE91296.1 ABC transporter substrate-binding protein [Stappia taiwanensis]
MKLARFAAGLAAGLAMTVSAALAEQTTLRITLQLPMKSHLGQNLLVFKEKVEAASNGEVAVEIYDSAQLYKDKEVPQAVGSGAIEMGVVSLTRYVGDVPAVDLFYMPFLLNSEELVRKAVAPGSPVRGPLDEAILDTGSRVLWWQAYGGSVLLSNGGPIKTPADLAGKKVRVFGKTLGEWVKAAGGAPTLISGSEQYIAYQRGTVDIGMTGVSGVKSRRLWEVMDTITLTNNADVEFVVVVNEDFWKGLPEQHRAWINEAALAAEKDVRDKMSTIEAEAIKMAADNGMTIYTPTAEEIAVWKASAQPVYDQFAADAGELGQKVLDAARSFQN